MINYQVYGLYGHLMRLRDEELYCKFLKSDEPVKEEIKSPLASVLRSIELECQWLGLRAGQDRVLRFIEELAEEELRVHEFSSQLKTLREAIEDGLRHKCFYHYTNEKAQMVLSFEKEWAIVVGAFPKAKEDALAAVDCWALGHNTACVFHLMRVAEYGLRALARERRVRIKKKPLEWAEWKDIITHIRKKIEPISKWRRGALRDEALHFYEGALGEFEGFREAYRNDVMHARKSYDEPQAKMLLLQVHSFMNRLSSKINETTKQSIRWKVPVKP